MKKIMQLLKLTVLVSSILVLTSCGGGGGGGSSSGGTTVQFDCSGLTGTDKLNCEQQNGSNSGTGGSFLSSQKEILSFSAAASSGTIGSNTINVTVPYGTNLTALVAGFTASSGASVYVGGTAQVSGVTANNFTSPVTYTVRAQDGSTKSYTVTVTISTTVPLSPTNVHATFGNAQVVVSWSASSSAWKYNVYYSISSSVSTTNYTGLITTLDTAADVSGLTNNTTYYFIVTALNGTLVSAASSPPAYATPSATNLWTWVSGSKTANQYGTYGTMGVSAATNIPGARYGSVSWRDGSGNLWLFGGEVYSSTTSTMVSFNDLWKFDGSNWSWVSGANTTDQYGTYGTMGVAAATNMPGARSFANSWIDSSGNFWLLGGEGYGSTGSAGSLNDLWKFDGTNWTWVSGANTTNQPGIYGTMGVASATNIPGARHGAISWTDNSGNLWFFGGTGYGFSGSPGSLNDLWKFDGTKWTWVSGTNMPSYLFPGIYGTKGVAATTNMPGARSFANSWIDSSGNLWLFGGGIYDSQGSCSGKLNDLWKFDGTNWTWVSGANTTDQAGTYGYKSVAAATNIPGARYGAVSWMDSNGNLWLFGGFDSRSYFLNDLWKFDGTNWTWMSGSNDPLGQWGTYGTKGVAATTNIPAARLWAVSWIDSSGNFWLFGGNYNAAYAYNDLWRYQP